MFCHVPPYSAMFCKTWSAMFRNAFFTAVFHHIVENMLLHFLLCSEIHGPQCFSMFCHVPEHIFRHVPEYMFRHVPPCSTTFRHVAENIFRHALQCSGTHVLPFSVIFQNTCSTMFAMFCHFPSCSGTHVAPCSETHVPFCFTMFLDTYSTIFCHVPSFSAALRLVPKHMFAMFHDVPHVLPCSKNRFSAIFCHVLPCFRYQGDQIKC